MSELILIPDEAICNLGQPQRSMVEFSLFLTGSIFHAVQCKKQSKFI
jgi:hypothetical protein